MSSTHIIGKVVLIEQPAFALFNLFSDMRNFMMAVPLDKREGITFGEDYIEGEVKGMKVGVKIDSKIPISTISYKDREGGSPFPFTLSVFFNSIDSYKTEFHIELEAQMNFAIKMMIGSKLEEGINELTEKIAQAFKQHI